MFQTVCSQLRGAASRAALPIVKSFKDNGAKDPLTIAGVVGIVAYTAASKFTPDDVKCDLANRCVTFYRAIGVKEKHVPEQELKQTLLFGAVTVENIVKATPVFVWAYQATHLNKLPPMERLATASIRSLPGTAACVPALAIFYVGASVIMPWLQSKFMENGVDSQTATTYSRAATFVGLGSAPELAAEAYSYQIPMSKWQVIPMALGSVGIAGRLAAGVLTQYNSLEQSEADKDPYAEEKAMAKGVASTTFAQWAINGCMYSMEKGQGGAGILRYLWKGCPEGKGSFSLSAQRFGGTAFQRATFMAVWTHLTFNSRNDPTPQWAKPS